MRAASMTGRLAWSAFLVIVAFQSHAATITFRVKPYYDRADLRLAVANDSTQITAAPAGATTQVLARHGEDYSFSLDESATGLPAFIIDIRSSGEFLPRTIEFRPGLRGDLTYTVFLLPSKISVTYRDVATARSVMSSRGEYDRGLAFLEYASEPERIPDPTDEHGIAIRYNYGRSLYNCARLYGYNTYERAKAIFESIEADYTASPSRIEGILRKEGLSILKITNEIALVQSALDKVANVNHANGWDQCPIALARYDVRRLCAIRKAASVQDYVRSVAMDQVSAPMVFTLAYQLLQPRPLTPASSLR